MNLLEHSTSTEKVKSRFSENLSVYINKMKGVARKETRVDYIDSLVSATGVLISR